MCKVFLNFILLDFSGDRTRSLWRTASLIKSHKFKHLSCRHFTRSLLTYQIFAVLAVVSSYPDNVDTKNVIIECKTCRCYVKWKPRVLQASPVCIDGLVWVPGWVGGHSPLLTDSPFISTPYKRRTVAAEPRTPANRGHSEKEAPLWLLGFGKPQGWKGACRRSWVEHLLTCEEAPLPLNVFLWGRWKMKTGGGIYTTEAGFPFNSSC